MDSMTKINKALLAAAMLLAVIACGKSAFEEDLGKVIEHGRATCEPGYSPELVKDDQCVSFLSEIRWEVDVETDHTTNKHYCGLSCACHRSGQTKKCANYPKNEAGVDVIVHGGCVGNVFDHLEARKVERSTRARSRDLYIG